MKVSPKGLVVGMLFLALGTGTTWAQNGYDLFQQALVKERAEGRLDEAIQLYQRIVQEFAGDRTLAAQAQLQIGICYEKLGKVEAQEAYKRVMEEFTEQYDVVAEARTRLVALEQHTDSGDEKGIVVRQVWADPDTDIFGSPSPDGRYLSFMDGSTGNLAVRDLANGQNRLIAGKGSWSEGFALYSRVSPDGKQVAYSWFDLKDHFYDLRLAEIDGSNSRLLYRNEEVPYLQPADWLPDGKHILAVFQSKDRTNQIVLVSVADGSVRVLKTLDWRYPQKMSFSPDGRYVAYAFPPKEDSPQHDIFLLATDGSREIPLMEHPANDLLLGWAPDGKTILLASDRTGTLDAWVIEVADGRPQGSPKMVKRDIGQIGPMGFTRKGSFYYGVRLPRFDPYMATLDPVSGKVLAPPMRITERFQGSNTFADWSPDGEYLAYILRGDEYPAALGSRTLCIRSLESGEEREIPLKTLSFFGQARWSPDGRFILGIGGGTKRAGIYQVNVQTGEVSLMAEGELSHPALSPDGKKLFFVHAEPGEDFSVRVRDLQSAQEEELYGVALPSWIRHMALSPDGQQLAFAIDDQGTQFVKIMPAAGGEARELLRLTKPEPGILHAFAWTSDGRYLLIGRWSGAPADHLYDAGSGKTELWRIPADGGKLENLGVGIDWMSRLRVHPDGRRIGFTGGPQRFEVWVVENLLPELGSTQ